MKKQAKTMRKNIKHRIQNTKKDTEALLFTVIPAKAGIFGRKQKRPRIKYGVTKLFILLLLFSPQITFAGILDPFLDPSKPISNPYAIRDLIINIINFLLGIAGTVATLMIIISGLKYITSQGNEEKTQSAKNSLTASVTGLLIIISAYVIIKIFVKVLGGTVY